VRGSEFIRKIKRLGRKRNVTVLLRAERGKGSHATLYYGSRYAVMPDVRDELKTGTLHAILDELGLTPKDFR
jgi:mRNA interferase HicA